MQRFFFAVLGIFLFAAPAFAQHAIYPGWQNPAGIAPISSQYSYSCLQLYSNLERGVTDASSGGQVSALQRFLAGYYRVDPAQLVVGVFGPLTEHYVTELQRARGLSPVGIVGPYTRAEIQRICAPQAYPAPMPVPVPAPQYPPMPYPAPYYPPTPAPQPPALYSFSPTQGPVGTQVVITGTDFTQDNTVHFGSGGAVHVPAYGYSSGMVIYFTVPSFVGPCSFQGDTAPIRCFVAAQQVVPGNYAIYVSNENGQTGSIPFTVTAQ